MAEPSERLEPLASFDGLIVVQAIGNVVEAAGNRQPGEPEVVALTLVERVGRVAALAHREGAGFPPVPAKVLNVRLQETDVRYCPVCQRAVASWGLQLAVVKLGAQIDRFVFGVMLPSRQA